MATGIFEWTSLFKWKTNFSEVEQFAIWAGKLAYGKRI